MSKNNRGRPASKDYYLEIQQKRAGRRHDRGKRQELAFVVVLFVTSILRTDKLLNVSVLHRAMEEGCRELAEEPGVKVKNCVSYSQLKRIISVIDQDVVIGYFDGSEESEKPVDTANPAQVGHRWGP